ncbi:PEP-CTERM system TPR-repeat protein PrsT [Motilimonas cestriensis]|uniref:PEP-CTERM system TPR-repeat protein PrsT n=1 Tax=Motilimonas cestriensis TaxID=2742685 RepID=A0ABS8WED3_9GAMM|nr:XrtA/PEP-CTERM system TPR-repeat protein PrsT [Motilimonas cestriensis]MCE2596845.1 PEP-CTERM system TPR-repeat protein PrsT [Motilimonas cestriensis]
MISLRVKSYIACFLCFCLTMLVGCGETSINEQEAYEKALAFQQANEHSSAIIEFKNVMKVNPSRNDVKMQLADSYIYIGMYPFAEKELTKVLAQESSPEIKLKLAKVLLMLNDASRLKEVLANRQDWPVALEVDALAVLSQADLLTNQPDLALAELKQAKALNLVTAELLFASALQALAVDDEEEALKNIDLALAKEPNLVKAMVIKGQVLMQQQRFEPALALFNQAATMQYANPELLMNPARVYVLNNQLDLAHQQLDKLLKIIPEHIEANYFKAFLQLQAKNYEQALVSAEKVLKVDNEHIASHFISAASAYSLEQYEKAFSHATKVTYAYPGYTEGLKLKAAIQFKLGDELAATETLSALNASDFNQQDIGLLKAAGQTQLLNDDFALSQQLFEQAAQLAQDDQSLTMLMTQTAFLQPDIDKGIEQLEIIKQKIPEQEEVEIALIVSYLKKGDFNEVLQRAKALQTRLPKQGVGLVLQGIAYVLNRQLDLAEQAFLAAREIEPSNLGTLQNLAAIALQQKNYEQAEQYYLDTLAIDKTDLSSLLQLYLLAKRKGEVEQGLVYLKQALQYHPDSMAANLPMIEYFYFNNQPQQALVLANNMLEKHPQPTPEQAKILFYSGVVLQYYKQWEAAKSRLESFVDRYPASYLGHFHLATVYAMSNDLPAARSELDKAIQANSFYPPIAMLDIRLLLSQGEFVKTRQAIQGYREKFPNTAVVDEMQARLELAQGNFNESINWYQKALAESETNYLTVQLANAHWSAGQADQAIQVLTDWLSKYDSDVLSRRVLADYQMVAGQDQQAIDNLVKLSSLLKPDAHIENNLAWLYQKQGKADLALGHAETAHDLAPDNAGIMDTLAVILLQKGDGIAAERLLTRAVQFSPDDPDIQYHLAQAMIKNGKKEAAKEVLEKLISNHQDFPALTESKALLLSLS